MSYISFSLAVCFFDSSLLLSLPFSFDSSLFSVFYSQNPSPLRLPSPFCLCSMHDLLPFRVSSRSYFLPRSELPSLFWKTTVVPLPLQFSASVALLCCASVTATG
ncbi:hypothetical protein L6164_023270 [Bauhinia variegata]|uniref:Uncharacterized protein n=1 Tax=Bauhinia variegata TaxID=167791 RepID=A0ACB9MHP0_BAUVA|nr:hypothetical protein L6164_023270 [Bauhinia variegata]